MPALTDYVQHYALSRDVTPGTVATYLAAAKTLDKFVGRPTDLADLCDDLLNRWITWMVGKEMPRATIKGKRGSVLTLWRAAYDDKLVTDLPKRVKLIRAPAPLPEAWDQKQAELLLLAAAACGGVFRKIRIARAPLLRALILTAYYSGLRSGDYLALELDQIGSDGAVFMRQSKTGWPILVKLPPDCMAAIEATFPPHRKKVFPVSRKTWYTWCKMLVRGAGLRGSPKWLRRTGATAVEGIQAGAATAFLGHKTPGMAWKHYIDRRLIGHNRPMPPPLTG